MGWGLFALLLSAIPGPVSAQEEITNGRLAAGPGEAAGGDGQVPTDRVPEDWRGDAAVLVSVVDESGSPLPGARVSLRLGDAPRWLSATADEQGRVRFSGLRSGEWEVDVRREGFMLFNAYVLLEPGRDPKVAFSSRQRTGTYWEPLRAVFLPPQIEITRGIASGRQTAEEAREKAEEAAKQARREERRARREAERGRLARVEDPGPPVEPVIRDLVEPSPAEEEAESEAPPEAVTAEGTVEPEPERDQEPRFEPVQPAPRLIPNPNLLPAGACPECAPGEVSVAARGQAEARSRGETCSLEALDPVAALAWQLDHVLAGELDDFAGSLRESNGNDVLRLVPKELRAEIEVALDAPDPSCEILGVVLPAGSGYVGFAYQAGERSVMAECPDVAEDGSQECQVQDARWLGPPRIVETDGVTLVLAVFENGSRRSTRLPRLVVYFTPPSGWLPPTR